MINYSWLLAIRTDYLTSVFRPCRFFVSVYFFIAVVLIGIHFSRSTKTKLFFLSLVAFLVPISTLINSTLKNLFGILRPDVSLHLVSIPASDPFGFPSGDTQIATVFWLTIFLSLKDNYPKLRYLCLIPIVVIGFSRIYLGVHSIYDVIGGWFFGILTVYLWKKFVEPRSFLVSYKNSYRNYWIIFISVLVLYLISLYRWRWNFIVPEEVLIAVSVLTVFGLFLKRIIKST